MQPEARAVAERWLQDPTIDRGARLLLEAGLDGWQPFEDPRHAWIHDPEARKQRIAMMHRQNAALLARLVGEADLYLANRPAEVRDDPHDEYWTAHPAIAGAFEIIEQWLAPTNTRSVVDTT